MIKSNLSSLKLIETLDDVEQRGGNFRWNVPAYFREFSRIDLIYQKFLSVTVNRRDL